MHYWRIKFSIRYQRLKTGNAEIKSINLGFGFNCLIEKIQFTTYKLFSSNYIILDTSLN